MPELPFDRPGPGGPEGPAGEAPRPSGHFDPNRMPPHLRRLLAASIVVSLAFAGIFIWSDKGLGELRRLDRRAAAMREDIVTLTAENKRLQVEIADATRRKGRVERLVREELGLVRPGEVVLLLPPSGPPNPADLTEPPRLAEVRERDAETARAKAKSAPPVSPASR